MIKTKNLPFLLLFLLVLFFIFQEQPKEEQNASTSTPTPTIQVNVTIQPTATLPPNSVTREAGQVVTIPIQETQILIYTLLTQKAPKEPTATQLIEGS